MGSAATYLCLGPGFSSAANTPFRRHKTWVHEGGISTPFIVHWPAGIAARNELRSAVGHVIDIAPTILDLAGVEAAVGAAPPMSGKSLKDVLREDRGSPLRALWFYHEGNRALRQGDWKIIHANATRPFPWRRSAAAGAEGRDEANWCLYNLHEDRAEQNDSSAAQPARVEVMAAEWIRMRDQFLRDATVEGD
jgi:arylsulfatase